MAKSSVELKRTFEAYKKLCGVPSDFIVKLHNVLTNKLGLSISDIRKRFHTFEEGGIGLKIDGLRKSEFFQKFKDEFGAFSTGLKYDERDFIWKVMEIPNISLAVYMTEYINSSQGYFSISFYTGPHPLVNATQLSSAKFKFRFDLD